MCLNMYCICFALKNSSKEHLVQFVGSVFLVKVFLRYGANHYHTRFGVNPYSMGKGDKSHATQNVMKNARDRGAFYPNTIRVYIKK